MATMEGLGLGFQALARRRRRQRTIVAAAIGVAFLASAAYWLGFSGVTGFTIAPTPGSSNGAVAVVSSSTLSGSITRQGNLTVGVPVSRIVVASSRLHNTTTGQNIRVSLAWTNASTAVLNGNDLLAIGLWYPVSESSGSCHSGPGGPNGAGAIYVADNAVTGATGVCVEPDLAATGSGNVDTGSGDSQQGMVILSKASIGGFLVPGTGQPSTIALCSGDTIGSDTWCQPPGVGVQNGDTRTIYVLAQVVNHGGNVPPGQQPAPGSFTFFTHVKAIG